MQIIECFLQPIHALFEFVELCLLGTQLFFSIHFSCLPLFLFRRYVFELNLASGNLHLEFFSVCWRNLSVV